jgi:hypothetical protein
MKIGLSFSRCVLDIVEGRVDINDVLVVIARTDFDPRVDEQWKNIWEGYGGGQTLGSPYNNPEWIDHPVEDEDLFRSVSIELWETGRLHQPRKFGAHPSRRSEIWLETVLPDSELATRPAVKEAWDQFQMLAGLTNTKLDKSYQ